MARMQRFHRGRWVRVLGWNIHILREVHDDFDFGKQSSKDRMMAWPCSNAWPKKSEETNVLQKWGLRLGTSLHQLILVKAYWPRWCRMHLSNTTTFRERHSVQTTPFTTEGCNLIARIHLLFRVLENATNLRFAAFPNITSSILHVQDQMWIQNDAWLKHLLNQMIRDHPAGHHEYISAQVFFFFGLRICGA